MIRAFPLPSSLIACLFIIGALIAGPAPAEAARLPAAKSPVVAPSRSSGRLGPLINIPQTWNNCGPSSVAEVLSYWGIDRSQAQVQAVLRADGNPYGMAPYGVPGYMRGLGMRALLGVVGSERLVKALVSNGFPVIVSQYVSATDHVGHYRPIQAYSDKQRVFVSSDPYLGQDHTIGYDEFNAIWQSTNRRFLVLYPPSHQALLQAVLAADNWDATTAFQQDLAHDYALLQGRAADTTGYGSPKGYYLSIAWDDLQLRRIAAGRQALQQARRLGASPIVSGWITDALARA
ncbi:MAG TPA: C39 family peptidase [Chloroflexota bacterium]|nr:C39 family peptidase [Chloroflexota bacterium]